MTTLLVLLFIVGYAFIAAEHFIKINKAATALITGVLCWTVFMVSSANAHVVNEQLAHHLGELSGILFFLLGAMTIVELIDAHDGFEIITSRIQQTSVRKLLWIVALLTFFLSAVLDNLTTTIVMVSLLRKLINHTETRLTFAGVVVIAANAGGAWSPIGDVTTTMLWIGGQVTSANIIAKLIVPSLVCLVVPLLILMFVSKGKVQRPAIGGVKKQSYLPVRHQLVVFIAGVLVLVLVPVFKTLTHLPPYMGVLIGLGILWAITEVMHVRKDEKYRQHLSVASALRKIDTPSILFFFGILMCIAALQTAGVLQMAAQWMTQTLANDNLIVLSMGFLSAIVDNVPLVAAAQGMYSLSVYPADHYFWEFLAYCTGTGGSALIIGSAAGVAAMGIENINFFWYLKRISWLAVAGYLAGAGVYILQHTLGF
jgi:Na+/H+ antiporter NhaD/arsenite permease-like protein